MAEKNIYNRISQNNQGNRCRNGKQGAVFNRFVLAVTGCFDFSGFEVVGEYRQQSNADSRANHAERQLLNAVGIVEPGDGSGSDQRNNNGVNHHVNLIDAGSENAGSNTFEQGFDFSIMQQAADVELRFDADVNPPEKKCSQRISSRPAMVTPQEMPWAGVSPKGTKAKTATIIVRLRITGAAAGPANLPKEFKMPD